MLNLPPVPTLTVTRLGMVWPGPKLRLEAKGGAPPVGKAVSYVPALGSVAVRFSFPTRRSSDLTWPWPVACTSMLESGPIGLWVARVSRLRAGGRALKQSQAAEVPSEYQKTTSAMTWVKPTAL